MIRVAVSGAAGRMGSTVCKAVEGAEDMELVARADPGLDLSLAEALAREPDVLVDFSIPSTAVENIKMAVAANVDVVVGTTGFDLQDVTGLPGGGNVFIAPNFAIGAVLMMRFAAEAYKHMAKAEVIELHHDRKVDAPSGTAALTGKLMGETVPEKGVPPIHSVRLPGLVAHQEVIFGDIGQTLTIRHDSVDRESFMPGVLLAIRKVGTLTQSPLVGLEQLL